MQCINSAHTESEWWIEYVCVCVYPELDWFMVFPCRVPYCILPGKGSSLLTPLFWISHWKTE